jgi:hypothetical protein
MGSRRNRHLWALRVRAALGDARRRLVALCAAVVLVAGSLASGRAYLWCVPLQQAMHDCCCPPEQHAPVDEQPAVRRVCCDVQIAGDLPVVRVPPPGTGLPASGALLASFILPAPPAEPARRLAQRPTSRPPRSLRYGPTRAGPSFASDTCIRLQIFRC